MEKTRLVPQAHKVKHRKVVGLSLAICLILLAWPILASAQKGEGTEGSKGVMEAYKKDIQNEMRALDKKIAALDKKIRQQGSKLEGEAKQAWDDLKAKQKVMKGKLKGLSSATQETWEKAKTEAEAAKEDLQKAFDKVASYFK
jgi:hypothetical protein